MVVAHAYGLDMEIVAEAVAWSTAIVVAAALASLLSDVPVLSAPPRRNRGRARATSSARSSFWELLGFQRVEPPPALARRSPGSNARAPRST